MSKKPSHNIEELIIIEMYEQNMFPHQLHTKAFVEWEIQSGGSQILSMLKSITRSDYQVDANNNSLQAMDTPTELIHPLSI